MHVIFECKNITSQRDTIIVDDNPGYGINQKKLFLQGKVQPIQNTVCTSQKYISLENRRVMMQDFIEDL